MIVDKFEEQRNLDRQTLFREKEVQSLRDMIYGEIDKDDEQMEEDSEYIVDTNRFEVNFEKLKRYLITDVKKKLKSKFITG